jgi:hypothetical protein
MLHHLFAVRTLGLFERLSAAQLPSYLSGLLIGEELRTQSLSPSAADSGPVILIGSDAAHACATPWACNIWASPAKATAPKPPGRACSHWHRHADRPSRHRGEDAARSESSHPLL